MNTVSIHDHGNVPIMNRDCRWDEQTLVEHIGVMKEAGPVDGTQPLFVLTGHWDGLSNNKPENIPLSSARLKALQKKRSSLSQTRYFGMTPDRVIVFPRNVRIESESGRLEKTAKPSARRE